MQEDLNQLVAEAYSGSKAALETIVGYAQGYVYNLALRMLQLPMDADDATQEIMIKLITNLNQFRGESQFSTWIYRVASNHLLNMRMREKEKNSSFDDLSARLETSLARYEGTTEQVVEQAELIEEVRRSYTMGMLMCLNQKTWRGLSRNKLMSQALNSLSCVICQK